MLRVLDYHLEVKENCQMIYVITEPFEGTLKDLMIKNREFSEDDALEIGY